MSVLQSPYKAYQQNAVQTASPGQLVVMLYDGAIRFTKAGIDGIAKRKYMDANTNLKKAQSIIHELIAALNHDIPISKDLVRIYEYMLHCLIQANVKKDVKPAEEVVAHLEELREAWRQAARTAGMQTSVQGSV
jgi:flagellar protein FliS